LTGNSFAVNGRGMSQDEPNDFATALHAHARDVEALLRELLSSRPRHGEIARPERLLAAMRHGVLGGGKRLRPFLVIESAALFDADREAARRVAAALECVHCYSLIHDDLPAMDDDDVRRGQPTVHRAFDEATAILAGDSLLTLAFGIIADPAPDARGAMLAGERRLELVAALARAAGAGGMAGGQLLDLEAARSRPDEAGIITLQAMKTGALIRFACEAGAMVAGAARPDRERLAEFGSAVGLAFQLADDLLDRTAHAAAMGKATGKDRAAGKATLVDLHGAEWTRRQLSGLVGQAHDLLSPYGGRGSMLRSAAAFVAQRRS
jgi:farnesyl diphosphate synthase